VTAFTGEVHPLADVWPLLGDDDLQALAESIAENGLRDPIIIDNAGRLIDGRNRLAACRLAGVAPSYATLPGLDSEEAVAAFIGDRNAERRHLTSGQQAMGRALMLQAAGKRKNGRWERGSTKNVVDSTADAKGLEKAGLILDVAARAAVLGPDFADYKDLPQQVMAGQKEGRTTLDFAYRLAQEFDARSAHAEAMKTAPLDLKLNEAAVILDDFGKLLPLPRIEVPLTKGHRERITEHRSCNQAKGTKAVAA
jgi:hypothetical protein